MDIALIKLISIAVVSMIFFIHLIASSYHWFRYGTQRTTTLTALVLYAGGGMLLIILLLTNV